MIGKATGKYEDNKHVVKQMFHKLLLTLQPE